MTEPDFLDQPERKPDCPSLLKLSLSLVENELPHKEQTQLLSHVQHCLDCNAIRSKLRMEREKLYEKLPAISVPSKRRSFVRHFVYAAATVCLISAFFFFRN